MPPAPLVLAHNVTKTLQDGQGSCTLLRHISLEIGVGERVALLGPSGSGKSTLLNILGALDPHYEGTIEVAGERLDRLSEGKLAALRNQKLGFVFQAYNLLGHLSVLENTLLPARFRPGKPDIARAMEVLAAVGMQEKAHRRPHTLSGGERQRVAIARALSHQAQLVLCDEPTGNLDPQTAEEIFKLFDRLTEARVALFVATHDKAIASAAHRILRLRQGRLV